MAETDVEGVWVVGGIERTDERKAFIVPIQDRTKQTLLQVIRKHVKPGLIIYTDLWKGYAGLSKDVVFQYSQHFKDSETAVHANTIEGTWNVLKTTIRPGNK